MNTEAAPTLEDDTDLGPSQRKSITRASSRRGESRVQARRRVGNYRIVALLGEGGMAQVHLAVKHGPAGFKKLLVVKSMRDDLVDPIYVRSFMHEARLAAQLNHPNVIQTYEVGDDDGQFFIAMEYVEGQSMRAVQRRLAPKRLPQAVQLRILAEIARGLHHAHTLKSFDGTPLNIVHRDVSPQNVMLTYDGQVKLLDFGIAKAQGSDELTREGMIKGKIDYMAPEQLRGDAIDQRADVFALGAMMWESLTGLRFSGGAEVAEITKMHNRIMGREQKLRNVAPETPARLVEICEKAIALDPNQRMQTAEDFDRAIMEYLSDTSKSSEAQELAQIMEGLFATERKKMRTLLEEQLKVIEAAEDASGDVEVLVVHETEVNSGTPVSQSSMLARQLLGDDTSEDASKRQKQRLAVIGIITLLGMLAAFMLTPPRESSRRPSAVAPAAQPVVAETRAAAANVRVHIEAQPHTATATLDGVTITLPFNTALARDRRLHQLEISAPGYRTLAQGIALTEDVNLYLELAPETSPGARTTERSSMRSPAPRSPSAQAREVGAAPAPMEAVAQTPAAPASTDPAPTMQGTTMRAPPIESSNPYEE